MQNDALSYSRVAEILTKEMPDLMKRTGDDGLALQFVQDLKQALEKGMATSPKSAEVLVAKEAFDEAFLMVNYYLIQKLQKHLVFKEWICMATVLKC